MTFQKAVAFFKNKNKQANKKNRQELRVGKFTKNSNIVVQTFKEIIYSFIIII